MPGRVREREEREARAQRESECIKERECDRMEGEKSVCVRGRDIERSRKCRERYREKLIVGYFFGMACNRR
tara:strand:+ start:446 stop:658 length:213 start_codon:yes stop_codon:yes gene_type:complete